jgi:hypothetical protein
MKAKLELHMSYLCTSSSSVAIFLVFRTDWYGSGHAQKSSQAEMNGLRHRGPIAASLRSADTAMRLARHFGGDARSWLNLQSAYDLRVAEIQNARRLSGKSRHWEIPTPAA